MARKKSKIIKFLEVEETRKLQEPLLEKVQLALKKEKLEVQDKISIRDFALITLVYGCALRISEACKLKMNFLDYKNNIIYIIDGKGGDRAVPVPEPVMKNLELWLSIRPKWKNNDYVFTNIKGTTRPGKIRPLTMTYYNKLIDKLADESGVTLRNGAKPHPHTLRHSRAMELYDNTQNLEIVQAILGHSNISTTQVYAKVRNEKINQVMQKNLAGIVNL